MAKKSASRKSSPATPSLSSAQKKGITVVGGIIEVAICAVILHHLLRVEGDCSQCSHSTVTNCLKYVTIFNLVAYVLGVVYSAQIPNHPLVRLTTAANIVLMFLYTREVESAKCDKCTKSGARTFMFYYSRIILGLFVLGFLLGFVGRLMK